MLHKLGNKNFPLLGKLLQLHAGRHRVIAENISNVNTPNYRRSEFKFEAALKQAIDRGGIEDVQALRGETERPRMTAVRNNGNNVDIDMEMIALDKNAASFEVYSQLYRQKSQMVRSAIKGG